MSEQKIERQNPPKAQEWIPVTAADVARARRKQYLRWSGLAIALLLAGWFFYKRVSDPQEARQAYEAGVKLSSNARYQEAILNYNRTLSLSSDFVEAYRMRGRAYLAEGDAAQAIANLSNVVKLAPKDASAYVERGFIYLDQKDYAKAVADANQALVTNPQMARACNLRARAVRAGGNPSGAMADFTRAVELEPSLDNFIQRAITYQMLNQHALAVGDLDRAVEIAPDQPPTFFARSRSKTALGDATGARADFVTGRRLDGF